MHEKGKIMSEEIKNQKKISELALRMKAYESAYIKDLCNLLSVPSIQGPATDQAPYGKATAEALDRFLEIAAVMGFATCNLDYHVGYAEFGEGSEMIAVLCHLDVVPAGEGWSHDPFIPRIVDNVLYARGVADDKGPAMSVLYAMKALKDEGYKPPCRIRLIVGLNEESGFGCMKHYHDVKAEMPVAGFTADASFPAVFAEKGILQTTFCANRKLSGQGVELVSMVGGEAANMVPQTTRCFVQIDGKKSEEIVVEGKSSHASRPELGDNAIVKALKQLTKKYPDWHDPLRDLSDRYLNDIINGKDFGIACSDESGELTMNFGMIEVTPEQANLTFDIRYPVTKNGSLIKETLAEKMQTLGFQAVDKKHEAALNLGKDSLLVKTVMDVYNKAMESSDQAVAMGGGTYAKSIPNILAFGAVFPGTPDCMHQVDEHARIDDLLAASYIYKETLKALAENQR